MKKRFILTCLTSLVALSSACDAAEGAQNVGVVNFASCITDSKLGKQEQSSFESLKKQLSTLLEDTDKQLVEINNKLSDTEFMDGLSPEGEEELKNKFRVLNEELNRYQQQYYQVLNQANMRIVQMLSSSISSASERVAKEKKLTMVINKEACFFYAPQLEVTNLVVGEMDRVFEQESKKNAQLPAVQPGATVQNTPEAVQPEAQTQVK
ncbi:MAG: OmpH family outer membrane protein [Chlamydiales bacterium]|nr:OmpH family outer membrane protein [Chlamydiales bacterium]